ncbi:E3 SUMO-protein ligase NSE2, partial [Coemansia sp. RSA 2524]
MAGRVGAHMQLQNRLQGLRSSIQAISDIADDTVRVCTVAGLDLEELGETDSAMQVEASLRKLLDAQHQLDVERSLVTRLATEQDMADNAEAEYLASWEQSMATYNEQSDAAKYGKNTTYKEFREQLWEVRHDGEPMPRLFGDNGDESDEDL